MHHRHWILTLALCAASGAAAQEVYFNFDPQTDFAKYRTFRWEKHPKSADIDDLTMGQLTRGFEAAFAGKGLKQAASGPTDLVIVMQVAVKQETEITAFTTGGYGYGPGWRGGWYRRMGSEIITATTNTIQVGTVVLDLYDTSTKQLVWRGKVSDTVDAKAKPDKRQKNIDKAARKMLKNYPPKKKT